MKNRRFYIYYSDKYLTKGAQIVWLPNLISLISCVENFKEENPDLTVDAITEDDLRKGLLQQYEKI
jgi:hypothetical protein